MTASTGSSATTCDTVVTNAVLGTATATDDRPGVIVTRLPNGNVFGVGTTTITWTATDSGGNTAMATQLVTVIDDTQPTITAPADITRSATGVTTFISDADLGVPTASDNCGFTVLRSGVPDGNLFPHGATLVTYTVIDASGSSASAAQTVTITPTFVSVCAVVRAFVNNTGEANSLCAKLDAASAAAARNQTKTRDNQIQAFVNEVNAQRGKSISDANANTLISLAGGL